MTGWLSGPALKPMTIRAVFDVARALPDTPILAVGGVRSGTDAIELLLAGAWAVQVGTATLIDPSAPVEIARGVSNYLKEKRFASPADLRGRLRVPAGYDADPAHGMIPRPENPLIIALDVSEPARAETLASALGTHVGMLKVGLELFWAAVRTSCSASALTALSSPMPSCTTSRTRWNARRRTSRDWGCGCSTCTRWVARP